MRRMAAASCIKRFLPRLGKFIPRREPTENDVEGSWGIRRKNEAVGLKKFKKTIKIIQIEIYRFKQ